MKFSFSDESSEMPGPAASATNVGAGSPRSSSARGSSGGGGGAVRQRKGAGAAKTTTVRAGGTSSGGMWRFYTDDSPGIKVIKENVNLLITCQMLTMVLCVKVGPVPVLVMSLLFIACVFMLHIWGKYNRA